MLTNNNAHLMRWLAPIALMLIVIVGYMYFIQRSTLALPITVEIDSVTNTKSPFTSSGSQLIRIGKLQAHSASAVKLRDGSILLSWFAGSREGAGDVAIYATRITANGYSKPSVIVDRHSLGKALGRYYSKLGNPVLQLLRDGRLALYLVAVPIGGWSLSSIALLISEDNGQTWQAKKELKTSPFMNISSLVKSAPFEAKTTSQEQLILLPSYHEFLSKYSELLVLDANFRTRHIARLAHNTIQPVMIARKKDNIFFLRNVEEESETRFIKSSGIDRYLRVFKAQNTTLPNPNAAVSALALSHNAWLLSYNHSFTDRHQLTLAYSNDEGNSWRRLLIIENQAGEKFSYPFLLLDGSVVHLFYTYKRQAIKHVWWDKNSLTSLIDNNEPL